MTPFSPMPREQSDFAPVSIDPDVFTAAPSTPRSVWRNLITSIIAMQPSFAASGFARSNKSAVRNNRAPA